MTWTHSSFHCAGCQELQRHLDALEVRVSALEQVRCEQSAQRHRPSAPPLRVVSDEPETTERPPVWPVLPRRGSFGRRGLRLDAAHAPPTPHPLLVAALIQTRAAAAHQVALFRHGDALSAPAAVLDLVA